MAPIAVSLDQQDASVGVVSLIGEHDAYSSQRLKNELAVLLDAGVAIVVDLRDATFIDSETLSVLLSARHQAQEAELGYTVVLPPERYTQVHRLLELTGLESAFAVCPTLERATSAARAGQAAGDRVTAS